jgi:hypothetical protein
MAYIKLSVIGARIVQCAYKRITLSSRRMADGFELIDLPISGSESSSNLEIE